MREVLRYDREAILAGEVWRILTAHLTHHGWGHVLVNLLAVGVMGIFGRPVIERWTWLVAAPCSALFTCLALLLLAPEIAWYTGASGVLHGLYFYLAGRWVQDGDSLGWLAMAGLTGKVLWEQLYQAGPAIEAITQVPTATEAHLGGLIGGAMGLLLRFLRRPA